MLLAYAMLLRAVPYSYTPTLFIYTHAGALGPPLSFLGRSTQAGRASYRGPAAALQRRGGDGLERVSEQAAGPSVCSSGWFPSLWLAAAAD